MLCVLIKKKEFPNAWIVGNQMWMGIKMWIPFHKWNEMCMKWIALVFYWDMGQWNQKLCPPFYLPSFQLLLRHFKKNTYKIIYFCYIYAKQYPIIWIFYNKSLFTHASARNFAHYTHIRRELSIFKKTAKKNKYMKNE